MINLDRNLRRAKRLAEEDRRLDLAMSPVQLRHQARAYAGWRLGWETCHTHAHITAWADWWKAPVRIEDDG
jgi:hypothetical protein